MKTSKRPHVSLTEQINTPTASLPPASPVSSKAGSSSSDSANRPFMHEVQAARFFYMDQFVFLATASKVRGSSV